MPTVFWKKGIRFFFYSNENTEPIHIHIEKGDATGKIWLEPVISVAYWAGFTAADKRSVLAIINQYSITLRKAWYAYFG